MGKRITKISEKELATLIQQSIDSYFAEHDDNGEINPRINTEIPSIPNFLNAYQDDELTQQMIDQNNLNEGLIRTYPIETVIKFLIEKFQIQQDQILIQKVEEEGIPTKCLTLVLPLKVSNNTVGSIKQEMNVWGYFVAKDLIRDINRNISYILFEPKYSQDVSNIIRSKYSVLYHMTSAPFLEKIKNNGLCPTSKNSLFLYPSRVFFMKGDTLDNKQKRILKNVKLARDNSDRSKRNPNYNQQAYLLTLDLSKIPEDVKMYVDPFASSGGFFTYDNIPPSAIVNIEPFNP